MRRAYLFKERNVTRATKAVLAAGLEIARVEIAKDGAILVIPARSEELPTTRPDLNEWDEVA